jgi:hypothetical protein
LDIDELRVKEASKLATVWLAGKLLYAFDFREAFTKKTW